MIECIGTVLIIHILVGTFISKKMYVYCTEGGFFELERVSWPFHFLTMHFGIGKDVKWEGNGKELSVS